MGIESDIFDEYLQRTTRSQQQYQEAARWLPGGDTRTINHYSPYPVVLDRGDGCLIHDVDGNSYIDFLNNYSALIHGHAHPGVTAALERQSRRGLVMGAPSPVQAEHARMLCERVPSLSKVRYCNSGTEATLFAIRAARAFTGRNVVVKVDGGYHGTHDVVEVNMFSDLPGQPQQRLPEGFPPLRIPHGVPADTESHVLVVPFNDLDAVRYVLACFHDEIAAVIVEPMLAAGGGIAPQEGYLAGLRQLTEQHGTLLIFDEVATFRLGPMQERLGIQPDLTALGKIIGGGLPIGAFGGREDIMSLFDPTRDAPLYHSGTFCGSDAALAAGMAAMDYYGPRERDRLNGLGDTLLARLTEVTREEGIRGSAAGIGSYGHFHWGEGPLRNAADCAARAKGLGDLPALFHISMLNRGIFLSRRSLFCLSTPMSHLEVDAFTEAFCEVLRLLRPYIARQLPHLLLAPQPVR
ncbi:aspartate aminotransferase family protein [Streptomyces sp. NPDC057271]|uniref:aspartate aminotransferase family protein n=1 Tax=unclassified Streptomyces TaxID=2593676 RepID=UPI00364168D7